MRKAETLPEVEAELAQRVAALTKASGHRPGNLPLTACPLPEPEDLGIRSLEGPFINMA